MMLYYNHNVNYCMMLHYNHNVNYCMMLYYNNTLNYISFNLFDRGLVKVFTSFIYSSNSAKPGNQHDTKSPISIMTMYLWLYIDGR